jgi:hypothetical protein
MVGSATDALVVGYPHPLGDPINGLLEIETVEKLTRHWQQVGLEPIDAYPGFLGQATAFTTMPEARRALDDINQVSIGVPFSEIAEEVQMP